MGSRFSLFLPPVRFPLPSPSCPMETPMVSSIPTPEPAMDFQQNTSHQLSACRDSEEPGRRKEAGGGGSRDLGSSCPSALLAMGLSVSGMGRPEGSTMEANGS